MDAINEGQKRVSFMEKVLEVTPHFFGIIAMTIVLLSQVGGYMDIEPMTLYLIGLSLFGLVSRKILLFVKAKRLGYDAATALSASFFPLQGGFRFVKMKDDDSVRRYLDSMKRINGMNPGLDSVLVVVLVIGIPLLLVFLYLSGNLRF